MNKSGTWRTLFPEMQDPIISTPRKKQLNNTHLESHLDELFTLKTLPLDPKPYKKIIKNQLSRENPLSQSMYIEPPKVLKKSFTNNLSRDNPLNLKTARSGQIKPLKPVRTKITESKIACLPASKVPPSPPRVIKTKNSETYFDFLPGSQFAKALPVRKALTKILNKQVKPSIPENPRPNCKRLQTDKLSNSFYISEQFIS
jgi:hypothetical protein